MKHLNLGLSLFDLPEHNRDVASSNTNMESEKAVSKSHSMTATDEPSASSSAPQSLASGVAQNASTTSNANSGADVSKVAQAILSLADPRSPWVTGEKIIVTGGN